jgi:hypothetical protein
MVPAPKDGHGFARGEVVSCQPRAGQDEVVFCGRHRTYRAVGAIGYPTARAEARFGARRRLHDYSNTRVDPDAGAADGGV